MIHHPQPPIIARNLRQLADQLDDTGQRAIYQAAVLATRGWPHTTTLDNNSSRSSDSTSSTERSALEPGPYDNIDNRLARQLRLMWAATMQLQATLITILSQASDDDPVPAGTGKCLRCNKFVRPDGKRPHNRIQAGWCPACYRRWIRAGRPDRSAFIRTPDEETAA